jgi:polyisoprenyl-phosphate glycosyltransferase
MPALSLVIPCYDEAKNLPDLIARCRKVIANGDLEIIFVDNGSRDDTPRILAEATKGQDRLRTVRVEVNKGYGFGILTGLRAAKGDILAWTHADLQCDPADALEGLQIFYQHPSKKLFVKGLRYGRPVGDAFFTFGMSCFESLIFMRAFSDVNAQPTMFPRSLFERWNDPPGDFALDLFAYWSAQRQGYEMYRFPVYFGPRRHGTRSRWNFGWKSRIKMIRRVIGYSWQLRRKFVK